MTIRTKLLRLCLLLSLLPIVVVAAVYRVSLYNVEKDVSETTYREFSDKARSYLQTIVNDYSRIVQRDRALLEMTVISQAIQAEAKLAGPIPKDPVIPWQSQYDATPPTIAGLITSPQYVRVHADGREIQIPISRTHQVYLPPSGWPAGKVTDAMKQLSTMPETYQRLYGFDPKSKTWLYTALSDGVHTCWPGHGGYPAEYDPRNRAWYKRAIASAAKGVWAPLWTVLPDVSSGSVSMTCSMAIHGPDKTPAGVTAIDMPLSDIFEELILPVRWADHAQVIHAMGVPADAATGKKASLLVIMRDGDQSQGVENWAEEFEAETLVSADQDELQAIYADAMAGKQGVRRMRYRGRDCFWAYAIAMPLHPDHPKASPVLSLIILPYDVVVRTAVATQKKIQDRTQMALYGTSAILLCVLGVSVIVAVRRSRKFTRPIDQLADAATRLAQGDFETQVHVHTGDEFEHLGQAFNDVGPKLAEHESVKHSLELARQVQQNLLPHGTPDLPGLDIVAQIIYCDETGGDYYDYIRDKSNPNRIGFAVGDITGHGIQAALLMASARAVIRSHAEAEFNELGLMITDVNEHLVSDMGEGRFLTLFYGVIDANTRTVHWVSGGHDPAMWYHASTGQQEELSHEGLVLGIIDGVTYETEGPTTLQPGDILAIGTDGIWETMNADGEEFGSDRYWKTIADHADESAQAIFEAVVAEVIAFRGSAPQRDDITLMVIKVAS